MRTHSQIDSPMLILVFLQEEEEEEEENMKFT